MAATQTGIERGDRYANAKAFSPSQFPDQNAPMCIEAERPVHEQMTRLRRLLHDLGDHITEIEARTAHICTPCPDAKGEGANPEPLRSVHAQSIADAAMLVNYQIVRLNDILCRMEI